MHIDFALPVDNDLVAGFKEWEVRRLAAYPCRLHLICWPKRTATLVPLTESQGGKGEKDAGLTFLCYQWTTTTLRQASMSMR